MKLVGILNITPDSFSDGGLFTDVAMAIRHAEELFAGGAELVDVGAESTRPNAIPLSDDEEWQRLEPVLRVLIAKFPTRISLDTYHPITVEQAFAIGPIMVNDVTGMNNPAMVDVVVRLGARCVVSHLPGHTIQEAHRIMPVSSASQVRDELLAKATLLQDRGLAKDNIVLDPGIGFGKTMDLNWQLLTFAKEVPGYPVMIGYSRKRLLGEDRMELAQNLVAGKIARDAGATYLRVHDVLGHASLRLAG